MTETRNASPDTLGVGFGDVVENGWASEDNPTRRGYFVRSFKRAGRMNSGLTWEITDGNGKFWEFKPTDIGERLSVTKMTGNLSDRPVGMSAANETLKTPINDSGEGEPWTYCPECGSEENHHEDGVHKQCADCGQEWFSDIDYSDVVHTNLKRLYAAPSPKGKTDGEALARVAEYLNVTNRPDDWVLAQRSEDVGDPYSFTNGDLRAILAALSNPAQALPDGEVGQ